MGLIIAPLLILYITIAYYATKKISRIPKAKGLQWLTRIVCIVVFVGIITGDAIVGRIYLKYLCSQDGGIVINEMVEVGPEFFDERGRFQPKLQKKELREGVNIKVGIIENYKLIMEELKFGRSLKYRKLTYKIIDRINGRLVASSIQYSFGGGWFENLNAGFSKTCPENKEGKSFFLSVFKDKSKTLEKTS